MMELLRKGVKSKFALIPIGLIALSFVVWGVGDIFRGSTNTAVARVGNVEVPALTFELEYRNALRRLQQQVPGFTSEQAQQLGIDRQVLSTLIANAALDREAQRLKIGVDDEALGRLIIENPNFRGADGSFDRTQYEMLLRNNNYTPQSYEALVRADLMRGQIVGTVAAVATAPAGLSGALYAYQNEQRRVSYFTLPESAGGEIPEPDDAALAAYHQANAAQFSRPERRAITMVHFQVEDYLDEVEVAEEQIRARYEASIARYTTPERRRLEQIVFLTREAAEDAVAELAAGQTFEDVAATREGVDIIDLGTVAPEDLIDPAVAAAGFALEAPGAISDIVEGDFGYVLLRVREITPGSVVPYEEARQELRNEIAMNGASSLQFEDIDAFENLRAEGLTLEEAARERGIEVTTLPLIDRQGLTEGGTAPSALPQDPFFLDEAFIEVDGVESDELQLTDGSSVVFRVDEIVEAGLRPLEEVREDVRRAWLAAERDAALRALGAEIEARAKAGESLEALAADYGTQVTRRPEPLARGTQDANFSGEATFAVFEALTGDVVSARRGAGAGLIVARVDEVRAPDLAEGAAAIEQQADQLSQSLSGELVDRYVTVLRDRAGVEIFPARIEQVLTPSADPSPYGGM